MKSIKIAALLLAPLLCAICGAAGVASVSQLPGSSLSPALTHGPFVSSLQHDRTQLWARAPYVGVFTLTLVEPSSGRSVVSHATATHDADQTLRWDIRFPDGIAAVVQHLTIKDEAGNVLLDAKEWTRPVPVANGPGCELGLEASVLRSARSTVVIACVAPASLPSQPSLWQSIRQRIPRGLVLRLDLATTALGTLEDHRALYRMLYDSTGVADVVSRFPFCIMTDSAPDHVARRVLSTDFSNSARRALVEYGGEARGLDGTGQFTRRRVGDVEVFCMDLSTYANTESVSGVGGTYSLLGSAQMAWLKNALASSTASVKVLSGAIPFGSDGIQAAEPSWDAWKEEKREILRWIGQNNISGVVLVSCGAGEAGIVSQSSKDTAGYRVFELRCSGSPARTAGSPSKPDSSANSVALHGPATFGVVSLFGTYESPSVRLEIASAYGATLHFKELSLRSLSRR